MKLIVDLIYEGGLEHMRAVVSDTAEFGDYTRGPRVIDEHVRDEMQAILGDIQSGAFAREWVADMDAGETRLASLRAEAAPDHAGAGRRGAPRADAPRRGRVVRSGEGR